MEHNTAHLKLREENTTIWKAFTSATKPKITRDVRVRWQQSVEALAKVFDVPVAFVGQLQSENIEIIAVSKHDIPALQLLSLLPLQRGGTYCETTLGRDEFFYVPDATKSEAWSRTVRPDERGIRSYAGYPIRWPDGEAFGTLCLLDIKPLPFSIELFHILRDYQRLIERDLEHLLYNQHIESLGDATILHMREVAHRAKNHFSILSNLIQIIAARPNVDVKKTLANIDAKMRTMALLHEMLYSSASLELPVARFLEDVVHINLQLAHHNTHYTVDLSSLPTLDSRHVFDLGLLISELTTNAMKNFKGDAKELHISLACEVVDFSTIRLTFRDNGPGFSDEFLEDPDRLGSIGFTMLRSFARLMNGEYRLYNDGGAVIECTIRA